MKVDWKEEKEKLEKLIREGTPYLKIGEIYGVSATSVKKAARKLGIELKPRRKINEKEHFNRGRVISQKQCLNCGGLIKKGYYNRKFCCFQCSQDFRYKEKIRQWKENPEKFDSEYSYSFIKKYFLEKNSYKCELCGWNRTNPYTGKIPLELHHIDGNCTNNKEENIQLLCPNCHSLTETFGSLNKVSRRYKLKKYKTSILSNRAINLLI